LGDAEQIKGSHGMAAGEIEALQQRISTALGRISAGLDRAQGDQDAARRAQATLAAVQAEKAQIAAQLETVQSSLGALEADVQRLRQLTQRLSDACEALRSANAEGVGDAHLINTAMAAELETLRAARKAEMTRADTIMIALASLLDADGGDDSEQREMPDA
jgi:chromosome segregation ATPase